MAGKNAAVTRTCVIYFEFFHSNSINNSNTDKNIVNIFLPKIRHRAKKEEGNFFVMLLPQ